MRRRRSIIGLATLAACVLAPGAALGVSQEIAVGNSKTLSPNNGSATIDVGDTITWRWVGPDFDHSIAAFTGQAEQWSSDPGVSDADVDQVTHPLNFTLAHQFTTAGGYNYRCRIHPDKMFGTITVVANGLPTAAFSFAPPSGATVGQQVDFDASASSDPDGIVMNYEWDLDGNGTFETQGPNPSRSYASAGTYTVSLRVTDNDAKQDVVAHNVVIAALTPPVAAFTATPSTVILGSSVSYDGSGSVTGPTRTITTYDWDLDGDGSFETTSGSTATVSRTYLAPGSLTVKLRVTDSANLTAVAQQVVTINTVAGPPVVQTPTLTVAAAKSQRSPDRKGVLVTLRCDLACTVGVTGAIGLPGKKIPLVAIKAKVLAAGASTKVTLLVPAKSRALLKKLLGQRKKATATISVRLAGGSTIVKKVTLTK